MIVIMSHCIMKDCRHDIYPSVKLYLHIKMHHKLKVNEKIMCPQDKCCRDFKGWRAFRRHLISFHKLPVALNSTQKRQNNSNIAISNVPDCQNMNTVTVPNYEDSIDNEQNSTHNYFEMPEGDVNILVQEFATCFISKLYATPSLPRSIVQHVVEEIHDLLNNTSSLVVPSIMNNLKNMVLNHDVLSMIKEGLHILKEPFRNMETEYQRFKLFTSSGHYIQAEDYIVGSRFDEKLIEGRIRKETCDIKAKFIPMRKVPQKFLSLTGVLESILHYMKSLQEEKGILSNFIQGEIWQSKVQVYYKDKTAIPLFLFFDDLEVNNVLGSHATIQKLGAVFYSIPCLPPQFSSQLSNIFLALLFYSVDRSEFENTSVFSILVDELNYLQREGLYIESNTGSVQVFFVLGLILGDN